MTSDTRSETHVYCRNCGYQGLMMLSVTAVAMKEPCPACGALKLSILVPPPIRISERPPFGPMTESGTGPVKPPRHVESPERLSRVTRYRIVIVRERRFHWRWSVESDEYGAWRKGSTGKAFSRWSAWRVTRLEAVRPLYGRCDRQEVVFAYVESSAAAPPKPVDPEKEPIPLEILEA